MSPRWGLGAWGLGGLGSWLSGVTRLAAWAGIGAPLWGYWSEWPRSLTSSGSPKAMFCKKRRLAPSTGLAWYPARHAFVHRRCSVPGRSVIACMGWRHWCHSMMFSSVSGRIPFREGMLCAIDYQASPVDGACLRCLERIAVGKPD